MKNFNKFTLALAALFSASALLPAAAADMAGVVSFVEGDAKLKRGSAEMTELKLNDSLMEGDAIKTGPGGKVSLITKGGAEIRINENSDFSIPVKKRNFFNLGGGQMWSRMLGKFGKLNVRTPSAVCAVRGTEADIEQKEILTVKVYEGHVGVKGNTGPEQNLRAGQISTVGAGGKASAPRQMSAGEIGKWQEGAASKDLAKFVEQMGIDPKDPSLKVRVGGKDIDVKLKKK